MSFFDDALRASVPFFLWGGGFKKRILLLSLRCRRNLMPCKQKNHRYQRWFVCRNSELPTLSSEGNWLKWSADTKYCPFSVAVVRPSLQDSRYLNPLIPSYQWLLPVALWRVFPGWTQDDSYRIRRSSRTERGVRAYSPAWSELPTRN